MPALSRYGMRDILTYKSKSKCLMPALSRYGIVTYVFIQNPGSNPPGFCLFAGVFLRNRHRKNALKSLPEPENIVSV